MRRFPTTHIHLLAAACLLFAGCSTYEFRTPTSHWQTLVGQLLYSSPKRSIIGETVITRTGDDQLQLDFMAGPGLPILKLRKDGARGRAEAAFARVSWQGNADHPPGPLKSWFALHEIFSAISEFHGGGNAITLHSQRADLWKAEVQLANGNPESVKIDFPRSKERFFFHFSR